jgi:hypothetical protein
VAEQDGIVQLRDHPVRAFPLGAVLEREDLAIQRDIARPQMRRQGRHIAGHPGGRIELACCRTGQGLREGEGEHDGEQSASRCAEEAFHEHAKRLNTISI